MDSLAEEKDQVMARLERAGWRLRAQAQQEGERREVVRDKGAPWKKLANEKPKGETVAYETLLNAWKDGKVR